MLKNSIALNQNKGALSSGADFNRSPLIENLNLASNFFLAVKIKEDKVDFSDFVFLNYNQTDFLTVLKTEFPPIETKKIIEKLEKWEEELTGRLDEIDRDGELIPCYFSYESNLVPYGSTQVEEGGWYPNSDYLELENTRNILAELNAEILDCF